MMVTFVSQCQKNALKKTRQVLDAFADRIGDNTWQTLITKDGLDAVRKLLKKTASKSTAVSCHWIRSRSRSELVWVVGRRSAFDNEGRVPVNLTEVDQSVTESSWLHIEAASVLAGIAGLFHDIGKANLLFQNKLEKEYSGKRFEPFRHEWVSLKLFQAFVGSLSDKAWLALLARINSNAEHDVLRHLPTTFNQSTKADWGKLPPVAKVVAWLIVSHHRLPVASDDNKPSLKNITQWHDVVDSEWNSKRHFNEFEQQSLKDNWVFPGGTPMASVCWQLKARALAKRAQNCVHLLQEDWLYQPFTAHISRLGLMLADHYYSALPPSKSEERWQDPNYACYANTDGHRQKKQKLDEHNIAVASHAARIIQVLPTLRAELPEIESRDAHKALTKTVTAEFKERFGWQDKAAALAFSLSEPCQSRGFFGINMASTGGGKTLANAKIMYALAGKKQCRLSIALGLRTLTLQTGDALKKELKLSLDEIGVLIGSQPVKQLHELRREETEASTNRYVERGSDSATPLLPENVTMTFPSEGDCGSLSKWVKHDASLTRLLQAPVLVSTIDYLIPATEGVRGGRQIAPMLRLLSSDLVLDEPDDFSIEDLPALCRLVNWAGMLGSRVLLSTASMPPSLAYALFDAYRDGRKQFERATQGEQQERGIYCAWFDETGKPDSDIVPSLEAFKKAHLQFVGSRVKALQKRNKTVVKGRFLNLPQGEALSSLEAASMVAEVVHRAVHQLHDDHHVIHSSGKKVSIGLVRMANINPLVAVAKRISQMAAKADYRIYLCIYHSQFPLIIRSHTEQILDRALSRKDEQAWWNDSGIEQRILEHEEKNHIFLVLATPVAEVGRDHDYDWAIAEPSSIRSLIQLAGRVQRHRQQEPETENFCLLTTNYRGLKHQNPAFTRPGFEGGRLRLATHDVSSLLLQEEYASISAIPRIEEPKKGIINRDKKFTSLAGLEHIALQLRLFGNQNEEHYASIWWQHAVNWCGEMQALQPFRKSQANETFCLKNNERRGKLQWQEKDTTSWPNELSVTDKIEWDKETLEPGSGMEFWLKPDMRYLLSEIIAKLDLKEDNAWPIWTEIQLRMPAKDRLHGWLYSEQFGVYENV